MTTSIRLDLANQFDHFRIRSANSRFSYPVQHSIAAITPSFITFYGLIMSAETDTQAAEVANLSGITPMSLKKTLTEKLDAQYVTIEDISGSTADHIYIPHR